MQCKTVLTKVDARRTGELDLHDETKVDEHLKRCSSCGDSLTDVAHLADVIKTLAVAPPRSCRDAVCDRFDVLDIDGHRVWVAFSDRGLTMIHTGDSEDEFREKYVSRLDRELTRSELPDKLRKQVVKALTGEGVDKPQVDFGNVTPFEREVLETLTRIPRGEVRSYSWVARQVGRPAAIRAVGNICARNVVPFVVPCHRVVPASGGIGNYAFGEPLKRELLAREGVEVEELDELARRGIRYIGSKTTKVFCFPTCHGARRIHDENRIPLHDADEALERGFRPCRVCQPAAA